VANRKTMGTLPACGESLYGNWKTPMTSWLSVEAFVQFFQFFLHSQKRFWLCKKKEK
jgi:hypothetical protein